MRCPLRIAALLVAVGGPAALACSSDPTRPATDPECIAPANGDFRDSVRGRVVIAASAYFPSQIRVRQGMTVEWINCEPGGFSPHTATSDAGAWDSGVLQPEDRYSRIFTTAGTFPYHCTPHPDMVATVVVE
jgi:plastocyanin